MANQSTSLRGPLLKLQKSSHRYYLQLSKRFSDNGLIGETWLAMADDLLKIGESLRALPRASVSFGKEDEKSFFTEAIKTIGMVSTTAAPDGTLREHMARALDMEERVTITILAPLIHRLKSDWTDRSSDFYILVKAHITRLNRLILSYSGDPGLVHRINILQEKFEQEVRRPKEPVKTAGRSTRARRSRGKVTPKRIRKAKGRTSRKKAVNTARPKTKRAKRAAKRTKPLLKNIKVSRRRASR